MSVSRVQEHKETNYPPLANWVSLSPPQLVNYFFDFGAITYHGAAREVRRVTEPALKILTKSGIRFSIEDKPSGSCVLRTIKLSNEKEKP